MKKPLSIFFYNKGHGWIVFKLNLPGKAITIWLSSVFDPIPGLFKWVERIGMGDFPSEIFIDEEGGGKRLVASTLSKDEKDSFLLTIFNRDTNGQLIAKSELSKIYFVMAFFNAFQSCANKTNESWNNYDLKELPLESIKNIFFEGNNCITTKLY